VSWPITWDDVLAARARLAPHLAPTPLRRYAELDAAVGGGIAVWVKHENHLPTNAFKARNGLALISALSPEARARGVVAATRGNHGAGLAWAGQLFGCAVTICVPHGNNPEKNAAIRGFGAELIEAGHDYDSAVVAAAALVRERGMTLAHSTNDPQVIAGATTLSLELLEQAEQLGAELDAMVVAVGGGSQAVGALIAASRIRPRLAVYGVQAAGASAIHDAWHAGAPVAHPRAETFADGLATRATYDLTFPALREGLAGFITVPDAAIAEAVRVLVGTTHNLAEGAGAAGLAGVCALRDTLAGKRVAIILSGANIDGETLRRILAREL
jgi:threonine dehydratase